MDVQQKSETPVPSQKPQAREWRFRVVDTRDVRPNMRRVLMTCDDIGDLHYRPGQALMMMIPLADGQYGRRDYTIRSLDAGTGHVAVDFLLHGNTPGPIWARSAKQGDEIIVRGPRGMIDLDPVADWHLFTGDETCIPAIAHLLEAMPAEAKCFVFIETGDASGEVELARPVQWLHRGAAPAGPSDLMTRAVAGFAMPSPSGHAYLIGETSNVRRQRRLLIERGMTRNQIASEGYWRPGRIGGHDHVDD